MLPRRQRAMRAPGPSSLSALKREGHRQLNAGAYADALASFRRLVDATPTSALARYHLALALFALGAIHEATTNLRTTLERRPHLPTLEFLATIAPFDPALDHRAVLTYRRALYAALRRRCGGALRVPARSPGMVLKVGYLSSLFKAENWV